MSDFNKWARGSGRHSRNEEGSMDVFMFWCSLIDACLWGLSISMGGNVKLFRFTCVMFVVQLVIDVVLHLIAKKATVSDNEIKRVVTDEERAEAEEISRLMED